MRPWRWYELDEDAIRRCREEDYRPSFGGENFAGLGGPVDWLHPGEESGPHAGRGPRGYRRPDERIVEDIVERLTHNAWVDATDVHVESEDGEVTLTGMIENRAMKWIAEDEAYCVWGVRVVQNQLRIKSAPVSPPQAA
jgi:hypothetical protein